MKYPNIDQSPTRATRTLHKKTTSVSAETSGVTREILDGE